MAQAPTLFQCPACGGMVASTAAACPHCGHRPAALVAGGTGLNISAVVILLGGLLVALGSFLPWATASSAFTSVSKSGLEGGDGILTVFLGVVLALLGLMRLQKPGLPANRLTMVLLGVVTIGAAVFEGSNIQSKLDAFNSAYLVATVGIGIYVIGVGGALVLLASLFGAPSSAGAVSRS